MATLARAPRRTVVLIGFMGSGKSALASELAAALGGTAIDSDALLEERLGHPLATEFELRGEASFRASEEELVCELLAGASPDQVIALGGGSILSERVRCALKPHLVVLLHIDPEQAWERVGEGANGAGPQRSRPLAADRDSFLSLYAARRPLYESVADAHFPALQRGRAPRALRALAALSLAPAGARMIWAVSESGEYPVLIGRGLLGERGAGALASVWPLELSDSRAFCVSDETVGALYAGRLGFAVETIAVPAGEASKTVSGAERVWRALLAAGATRADHIAALGGGVVGDLAGFCAATYQRGVPVVHLPTTLLAQVDSAYGGKTGVDVAEAKNYVGVYHQPAGVLVDPDTLQTLPAPELASGWVEVLKTALIAGGELWESVARGDEVDEEQIIACARTKLAIVAADERDAGRRLVLNLGHTVAHAIEAATGYSRYRHGEAVGLGLLAALRLSGTEELRAQVCELLAARALPVTLEGAPVEAVLAALAHDKKRLRSQVPFVLLAAPGDVRTGCELAPADVAAAISELAV
jgi:shikimate kinase/3-dehydroquinate synthase